MNDWQLLEALGAPADVVETARAGAASWKDAWRQCARGDALIWIGAVHGLSLPHAVLGALACARLPFEGAGEEGESAEEYLDVIEDAMSGEAPPSECLGLADECERSASEALSTYRSARGPRLESAWTATTGVARAAEALVTAYERAQAQRTDRARGTAALLGIGISAALTFSKETELRLVPEQATDDPIQSELAYVVAAAAEATAEAARALAAPHSSGEELDDAHLLCAAMIREILGEPG